MAHWLASAGFPDVAVLEGGLDAWRAAGLPVDAVAGDATAAGGGAPRGPGITPGAAVLPSLADRWVREGALPARRRLATLFVDIAGSTRLVAHHPPEQVLGVVQRFLALVADVALAYCGDVKDYEGDGALLYFESTPEAARAALAIREALGRGRCETGDGAAPRLAARMSLTVGDVVIGLVGSAMRQAIALVGPSVAIGSRILKQIAPGGVIATGEAVEALQAEAPELADAFVPLAPAFAVPGMEGVTVATWAIPALPA